MTVTTIAMVRMGTEFPPHYVERLVAGVVRWRPPDAVMRFVCFTDQPESYTRTTNLPVPVGLQGWWAKLAMFRPGAFPVIGERVIYFDLDTVICGPLKSLFEYDGKLAILRDAYQPDHWQSAAMAWKAGDHANIWGEWNAVGRPKAHSDQGIIEELCREKPDFLQDMFPGEFASYKIDCKAGRPASARVIFFHGKPRPHDAEEWAQQLWRQR